MADKLLNDVIQLENRIQEQLRDEQCRADAWLERVRTEQGELARRAGRQLAEQNRQVLAGAKRRAEQQAAQLEAREQECCRRLERLDDELLKEVLRRQVNRILPGRVDDHQDVQS